jgi:hypothetical protein
MSAKHTPGPWLYRRMRRHFVIEAANGVRVAEVRYCGRPDGSTSETDAASIAALPELLEALRAALAYNDGCTAADGTGQFFWAAEVRAAITKATGEA